MAAIYSNVTSRVVPIARIRTNAAIRGGAPKACAIDIAVLSSSWES